MALKPTPTPASLADLSREEVAAIFAAAQEGNPAAQYIVGTAYEQGSAVNRDPAAAKAWYAKAAEQGYVPAKAKLSEPRKAA